MANYNCTQLGCIQDPTGTYPDLPSCQAACVGWGCPPQLTTNTDIVFIYDNSGSYTTSIGMQTLFEATTAWTETLTQGGWVGTQRHALSFDGYNSPNYQSIHSALSGVYVDGTNTSSILKIQGVSTESWLAWGAAPYYLDSKYKTPNVGQFAQGLDNWSIPEVELAQYWVDWKKKATVSDFPGYGTNTGGTFPTNDVLVVSFCHESSEYDENNTIVPTVQFKNHYDCWSFIYSQKTSSFTPKGFLASLFTGAFNQAVGEHKVMYTAAMGIQSILKGNQDDVGNGGTGTLDGTWITIPNGGAVPNAYGTCNGSMPGAVYVNYTFYGCSTVPGGMGTTNPCLISQSAPVIGCPATAYYNVTNIPVDWGVNNFWVAGQPTWGALEDKGWGAFYSEIPTINNAVLATYLNDFIGTIATPATICLSAETLYTANVDYPYQTIQLCDDVCFPLLDPWWCPQNGPCIQDPQGSFTFGPGGIYATSQDAYTACTAQCNTTTAFTCSNYGCIQDVAGIFPTLSACTAQCQSYSCTTEGCYGPFQGTGTTGTHLELSACTATCYHFECVTDSYAAQNLPNIYDIGTTSTDGCIQLPGSVGASPNAAGFNEFATLSACTATCVSWGCCEPLGITDNSVMYVYYDITSMNAGQTENAIKGIIDWTEAHTEFTGHVYHFLIWSERWLQYPTIPYTLSFGRFEDPTSSSYPSGTGIPGEITYLSQCNYGTTHFGHSSTYWNSTNSPQWNLANLYQPNGFNTWIDPVNYGGAATHSIHDSFTPGTNMQGMGTITKGYGGIASATTTDDVINVVFQDESYAMYHGNNATPSFGSAPLSDYKNDHTLYFTWHDNVTATTINNNVGGTIRTLLYPTQSSSGQLNASKNFALHSTAAISSGDLDPLDGKWSATTYPLNNANSGFGGNPALWTHAECEYNLITLTTQNPYFETGWGGLDQFGWSINFRFDTYNQAVFENDLTSFLQATTISCSTICMSSSTAPTPTYPYSSETFCNPQCIEYNCGDMGCYSAITGEYSSLSACTAQCESYTCSTQGCGIYNVPTGTTFPITQADGVDYFSYYGSGGTFSSNTDCELVCNSWDCGPNGCLSVNGTGGTYSSQTHCELSPCSGYTCTQQGCISFIGDGSLLSTPTYVTEFDCITGCTYWECDINLGCIEQTGQTTGSIYEFASEQVCQIYCASFNCGNNGCTQLSNLTGTYNDITNLPVVSSAACTASCFSYNCTSTGCTDQSGTGGTFSTNISCLAACQSYTCTTTGCEVYNSPNYGTGGTFTTNLSCQTECLHWECVPWGCQSYPGTGTTNSYSSLTQCLEVGFDPVTGTCTSYECTATGCIPLTGTGGQFESMSACTGVCQSYTCEAGTVKGGTPTEPLQYTGGGCYQYNLSGTSLWTGTNNLGTGGTFQQLWQCTGSCRSWDCTSGTSGCVEVSTGVTYNNHAGSGGTYLNTLSCESACTSYNCTNTGCFSQVGSGGTWFGATHYYDGYTACTGVCFSYNCEDYGCLPAYIGSGGTYFSADTTTNPPTNASLSAYTACTTACTSFECMSGGCQTYNSPFSSPPGLGYGTGGTFSAMSSCTASCIHWGCLNNPISTDSNIYAYYDTTSMGQSAVYEAYAGLEAWVAGFQNFTGNLYHTLINDERWLSWPSSVYTGAFTAGTATMMQNAPAMPIIQTFDSMSVTNVYDNMVAGQTNPLFPGAITKGPAPVSTDTDHVLVITFIDESGPNNGLGTTNVYTSDDTGSINPQIPNFAATTPNALDQATPTWRDDFSGYSATNETVLAATGSLRCFMYPTLPVGPLQSVSGVHYLFALHVVAAIDTGNQAAGPQGENWIPGTAPRRLVSGGIANGTPELCAIADLTALEISNPYIVDPIGNVGELDTLGWGYNISFQPYTQQSFQYDLDSFLITTTSNLSLCVSAQTSPTIQYPHASLSACTGECYSWECTATGCIQFNGTGGTPTYYALESDCLSACTSWNCTNNGCGDQTGTGGTFTSSGGCVTACTSYNCEDITVYTPSASWPIAPGCIEQIGSGGTFYQAAAGASGSSIMSYTACTAQCQSWDCEVDCLAATTGCTSWPNTAATYTSETACTGSCVIDWYCTEEYVNGTCDSQTIIGPTGGVINNGWTVESPATISTGYGALGWFADNAQNATWATYSFSLNVAQTLGISPTLTNSCPGPWIAQNLSTTQLPGYLHTLQDITFNPVGAFSTSVSWPRTYTNWASVINDFAGLGVVVNLGMNASTAMSLITGTNTLWAGLNVSYNVTPCICYTVPCDVFCDDGINVIPSNALGPYATSGIAETNCCTQVTWSCITETIIDSCSGKTTLPGQYASNTNAWDWLTVNLPNANLNTLNYESTTPAITISGACEGPNGGALYDVAPVSYSLLNPSVSYNVWNLFINQAQAHGATGLLSGMSYSNVNQYLYAQSGQTIQVCEEICHCSTTPCRCIELYDGTGDYLTHDDCISGTTLLPACCPNTGTTGTSWNCTSGITWNPICEDKPYLGHFTDQFIFLDNFRLTNPYGTFGLKRFITSNIINSAGVSVPVIPYTWNDVWTSLSASSIANGIQWQSCFKELNIQIAAPFYLPYQYIKTISHPAVSGGLGYTTWNSFYTAAVAAFPTLTTSQTPLQACQTIDSVYWGSNQFGCEIDMMNCCNRDDCYCYELYTTGGTFSTEAPCLTACCPTYTGWTCENLNLPLGPSTFSLPCVFVSSSSPLSIYTIMYQDTLLQPGQVACNSNLLECNPPPLGELWSCVTTEVNTCNPNGNSLGEITGTTNGPAIGLNGVQYPFSSSTDQLYPLLPTNLGYLGAYGQVETILTDSAYYSPFLPLSATTFQLGGIDSLGQNVVNPNEAGVINPLPYTLPAETCFGTNFSGGTGMPMFNIISVSHNVVNANTPYYTWDAFVNAAVSIGYNGLTNSMSVADVGLAYPQIFGCSETTLNNLQPPSNYPAFMFSGCQWHFEMQPCLCDTTCCCETGFTQGYLTEQECLDPLSGCCPDFSSYTCTINGCIDPGNGSGAYTGATALQDCEADCQEWVCVSSTSIYDSCIDKVAIPTGGGILPNITEFAPAYSGPYPSGPWDAIDYFADITNGLQGQVFENYKWECLGGCGWSVQDCDGPNGAWKYLKDINIFVQGAAGNTYNLLGAPYTSWIDLINGLNTATNSNLYNLSMDYNTVANMLYVTQSGNTGKFMMAPGVGSCYCNPGPCGCVLTGGTGHTGGYHLNNQVGCDYVCCSGITIPECSILITGQEEGVLYYDFDTNTTTKLFDEPGFEKLDIAARQNKLWIYKNIGGTDIIREYDVVWAPFQKVFNRDITVPNGLGRGLTATEDPNILLSATDKVYKLDITVSPAVATTQFPLPSGMTCTGDIVYDSTNGAMIITYGTGATQYVGSFDGSPLGIPLEESHINLTTPGIGVNEQIDSLFNYGTWTVTPGYSYFNVPYSGPIYGITTDRRVIELLTNPLQFAPVETQTLTLVNQITNQVHGASNILNIVNGSMHDCADITIINDDVYWCNELLGCLPYPSNITPPNSFGPHSTLLDCQNHCNFVCGDCVGSCECTLVTTTLGSGCNIQPTMADCIAQNQGNPNILEGGEGCCDCFGCDSVSYYAFTPSTNTWTQYTVTSNVSFGNFATPWNPLGSYTSGDVVQFTGPNGSECCYTFVNPLTFISNSNFDPYTEWTTYSANYLNNAPVPKEKIYWIPCDEDCPTVITWDCITGTPITTSSCPNAIDTGTGGLSFTPQIEYIATAGYALWHTQFESLKWDCGSAQNPLPPNPCVAPMGHYAKIIGCRVTHIVGQPVNATDGMIQTTWADFIDHVNSILVAWYVGPLYVFPYTDRWQDLEAILGSQSYDGSPVPGNVLDIECIWEYCTCDTLAGAPPCGLCMSTVWNYGSASAPNYVPMIDISTTYNGAALGNGTLPYNYNDQQQAIDIITNPLNGLFNTDFREMKWEKMPGTGPGGTPMSYTSPGCSPSILNVQGYPDCTPYVTDLGPSNGNFMRWTMGWSVGNGNFGGGWNNWADLLADVSSYINAANPANGMEVTPSDTYDELNIKIEWYWVNVLGLSPNTAISTWSLPKTFVCGCTGQTTTPSYDPCHCEPVYGPTGAFPTSAACEEVCCSGETSWSCNTGTTIVWEDSTDCSYRTTYLPNVFTTSTISNPNSPIGFIANQANGFQSVLFSDMRFVVDALGFANTTAAHPCYDVDEVMIPDGNAHWWHLTQVTTGQFGTPNYIVSTLSWKDFIAQASGPPWNHAVDVTMSTSQVLGVFGGSMGYSYGPCTCTGTPCGCVEITGTTGYPTSASCEVVCCPGPSAYDWECTGVAGCFQTPNGTYASLTDCETDCKEWECTPQGPCYSNCDTVGPGAPRVELPPSVWGDKDIDLLPYFANPTTIPLQHPNLPTITGNMQGVSIEYYKFDCSTCQLNNVCLSPHGSWFGMSDIKVLSLPGYPNMNYLAGVKTWEEVIDGLNLIGTFGVFGYNTPYTTVKNTLAAGGAHMTVHGEPCFGTNGPCDCILIDGTGHTGTWSLGDYSDCYSSCCQTQDTWDCEPTGCVLNNVGTGQYIAYSDCVADCKEWECIPGINNSDSCSGQTLLNVNWSTIPGGLIITKAANYFSHQLNGLQYQPVSNYKRVYSLGSINTNSNYCDMEQFDAAGNSIGFYQIKRFTHFYVPNNTLNASSGNPVFTNATNYDSVTNTCPAPGCTFDTWGDLIAGCQMLGITYAGNSTPLFINSSVQSVSFGVSEYFNLNQPISIRVGEYPCYCFGTSCNCIDIPGTGHTGNYYTLQSDCLIAANSNPCCTPPDDYWHCVPEKPLPGSLQGDCVCVQQPGFGGYPTLADCKADGGNCCDNHYYDCLYQGTPQAGCYGMVAPNTGPYQTIAQCNAACPKTGYNCSIIDDGPGGSGPGGSGYLGCVPCIGLTCQFTDVTAAGSPYFGDPLLQCQDNCPAKDCWKCCMNKFGQIMQLSPSTPPAQCYCPKGTVEVQCDGSGPCPYPVSCPPGEVYSHVYCKCVCAQNQSCPNGWHWSFKECKCVQNEVGPVDFVGPQGTVIESISDFLYQPVKSFINEFTNSLELLEHYTKKNYKTSTCSHCTDGTDGICTVNGCLYFIDYKKYGNTQIGWKSLLLGSETLAVESTTTDTPQIPGPTTEGYSCRVDQNKAPSYTICVHTSSPDYVSYFGNMPPLYATLQDCYNDGCDSVETPLGSWAPNTDLLLADEPKENKHSCCPVYNRPGYGPTWVSMNLCGTNHLMTGAPVLGVSCGADPNASSGSNDPYWCCEWTIITGSDIELKENIEKVGESESGINIYEFEYKDKSFGEGTFRGVIAQEVPQASTLQEDGYLYVNYSQIDVDFKKVR